MFWSPLYGTISCDFFAFQTGIIKELELYLT